MLLLALDTATLGAAVGLVEGPDGGPQPAPQAPGVRLRAARLHTVTTHSELLLALIDEVLREAGVTAAQLDAVVCGAGPGSFTGLRIGMATAKGLCFALDKPLVMVSSLAAMAARAASGSRVAALLDAYRGEVYAGVFRAGELEPVEPIFAASPQDLGPRLAALGATAVVGDGATRYPELVTAARPLLDDMAGPAPIDLGRLGWLRLMAGHQDDLAAAAPSYVRASEAEVARDRKANKHQQ